MSVDAVVAVEAVGRVLSGSTDGASNRNLIDNPWFTVNQRGTADATTISGNGYFADRWQATGSGVQRVAGGGINILGVAYHKLDNPGITGKTVTLSILYSDGVISSNTFEWTGTTFAKTFEYGTANIYPSANQINVGAQSVNVTAIKLELGSVSTLANDAPPCFAEELAKCQRYLYVIKAPTSINLTLCAANALDATNIYAGLAVPPQMRTPTLSLSSSSAIKCGTSSFTITPSSVSMYGYSSGTATMKILSTSLTAGTTYRVGLTGGESIIFSAEL